LAIQHRKCLCKQKCSKCAAAPGISRITSFHMWQCHSQVDAQIAGQSSQQPAHWILISMLWACAPEYFWHCRILGMLVRAIWKTRYAARPSQHAMQPVTYESNVTVLRWSTSICEHLIHRSTLIFF
jgi:hypothetical protein